MRIQGNLAQVHDRFHAGVELTEYGSPFVARLRPEDLPEGFLDHSGVRLQDLSVLPFGVSHSDTEGSEELWFQGTDAHILSVGSLIEIIDAAAVQKAAFAHGHGAAGEVGCSVHRVEGDDAVLHGYVDKLSLSCVLAIDDRGQDTRDGSHGSACHIGDLEVVEAWAA